jgi:hypothetical protein
MLRFTVRSQRASLVTGGKSGAVALASGFSLVTGTLVIGSDSSPRLLPTSFLAHPILSSMFRLSEYNGISDTTAFVFGFKSTFPIRSNKLTCPADRDVEGIWLLTADESGMPAESSSKPDTVSNQP